MRLKRAVDVAVSAAALIALSPVLLALSIAVLIGAGRPVFFSQMRVGRNFQPFRLWKFRSMRAGIAGPLITVAGDRRITRVGSFLRATKFDELPQLWNVLGGDMSLVGPCIPFALHDDKGRRLNASVRLKPIRPDLSFYSPRCRESNGCWRYSRVVLLAPNLGSRSLKRVNVHHPPEDLG